MKTHSTGARLDALKSQDKWLDLMIVALFLMAIGVIVAWVLTISSISTINTNQSEMNDRINQLESDLTRISEEVESWPGITEATVTTVIETEVMTTTTKTTKPAMRYVGEFEIYAYDHGPNGLKTASGAICKEGVTVAAVWSVFPEGTRLYIEDIGYRIVQDKCSNSKALDVFMSDESDCISWGSPMKKVWVIEND
jgi:3D (Asp-Asp-Asp) domain-containing protein